ncbi:glycine cleavage system H protein [Amycolatopsis mediterranei S699]|uniref:Glycine cleavage system H protein n=2 Tax=Amycolatopsis mediterranei TaxID=33910 RepID=A0A0H3D296_AMYMU|nr:glycine cleavage system protein GcvH [Amycolatopsis mediterranei]ADJ43626.1 glycine cleavage system H protein [Amycolatopsis mediterranei U32]AEK40332.1 glycine cleavage system H protein [Amycolatopsis mediterranei S699]AFO75338.1 glycine cleavage system H protein [Amycolatopsis mediterranei S699]AGT82467.1 glycine cleavage system H protein [Amycolatopsis mediterranei RB]KDO03825.1 glycine cleavage system protein H [Amycolatopsis mediterranei]
MSIPENLQYTKEHEWLKVEDGVATVGITAFAAESLGDIVFVQLPDAGSAITAGEVFGEVESTKSVSELYAPVSGEVVEVNGTTSDTPEVINSDPYTEGWLLKVRLTGDVPDLLDAAAYAQLTQEN